jgi:hypothetical protein
LVHLPKDAAVARRAPDAVERRVAVTLLLQPAGRDLRADRQPHLAVHVKVILTSPHIFCMTSRKCTGWCQNDVSVQG